MHHKIWHKPLHTRKIFREMSIFSKYIYYMKPFMKSLLDIWLQPLPFPTLFKLIHTFVLIDLIILPILYPLLIIILYYGIAQYLIESTLEINYMKPLDLIHHASYIWNYAIDNDKHALFVNLYLERWRYVGALLTSFVDYVRLLLSLWAG